MSRQGNRWPTNASTRPTGEARARARKGALALGATDALSLCSPTPWHQCHGRSTINVVRQRLDPVCFSEHWVSNPVSIDSGHFNLRRSNHDVQMMVARVGVSRSRARCETLRSRRAGSRQTPVPGPATRLSASTSATSASRAGPTSRVTNSRKALASAGPAMSTTRPRENRRRTSAICRPPVITGRVRRTCPFTRVGSGVVYTSSVGRHLRTRPPTGPPG